MNTADDIQVVTFRVGPQDFALRHPPDRAHPALRAPARRLRHRNFWKGVVPYAGGAIPVVDLRKRLDSTPRSGRRPGSWSSTSATSGLR